MDPTYSPDHYPLNAWQYKSPVVYENGLFPTVQNDESFSPNQYSQTLIGRQASKKEKPGKFQVLCKTLGFQLLWSGLNRLRGGHDSEAPKVAILKDRLVTLCRSSIHIIPILAAVAIITFNAIDYYIGGELAGNSGQDTEKLAGLQFAAKLHELFMLASITTIVFGYVRKQLINGGGVPFGAIFAGLQISNISFLWSAEMWGILMTKWNTRRRKATLVSLLIFATLLGVSVGPSTAVLMRPRLDFWPAGGTTLWVNGTQDKLWPLAVRDDSSLAGCVNDTGNVLCPHAHWKAMSEQYLSTWTKWGLRNRVPSEYYIPGESSTVVFATTSTAGMRYRNARTMTIGTPYFMADRLADIAGQWVGSASAATRFGHGQIARYSYRIENNFIMEQVRQPAAHVACQILGDTNMQFPNMSSYYVPPGQGAVYGDEKWSSVSYNNATAVAEFMDLYKGTLHAIMWLDDPVLLAQTNSSLNAVIFIHLPNGMDAITCSIDARYAVATIATSRSEMGYVTSVGGNDWNENGIRKPNQPQISIEAAWARYLNPIDMGTNKSIIREYITSYCPPDSITSFMEGMLANMVVNGLATIGYGTQRVGTMRYYGVGGWPRPKNAFDLCIVGYDKRGCDADSAFDIDPSDKARSTQLKFSAFCQGYSYSRHGATAIAAMLVLIAYSLFALWHFVYSFCVGNSSIAWDSPAEITALAMQSSAPKELKNTGSGIGTTRVFEEKVQVRVRDGAVEYVFNDTAPGTDRVQKDRAYS